MYTIRKIRSLAFLVLVIAFALFIPIVAAHAQENQSKPEYFRARVLSVSNLVTGDGSLAQLVKAKIVSGVRKGTIVEIRHGEQAVITEDQAVRENEQLILLIIKNDGVETILIADTYRLPSIIWILVIFFGLAIVLARWKGFTSLIGLCISISIVVGFIVPQLLAGRPPLLITLIGASAIAIVSMLISHGTKRHTRVAIISTLITLFGAAVLAIIATSIARLTGLGSEDAFLLAGDATYNLSFSGLLLSGIIIGTLGVLDDITTTQAAAVEELEQLDPTLSKKQLFTKGMRIGKEHIISLVNTLALAYIGASLPLLLLFAVNNDVPFWVTMNNEGIVEEIVRTVIGSTALIFAVPLTTYLATTRLFKKKKQNVSQ